MEALRAAYSDSSDSDSDALPPRSIDSRQKSNITEEEEEQSGRLPPPPLDLLDPPNSFDYLQKGQGSRIRSFPHVEGNYALHVFIPVHIPPISRKGLAQFLKRLACVVPGLHVVDVDIPLDVLLKDDQKLEQVALGREYHISLGRTVPIRVHQIDSVVTMLRQKLQFQKRYWIDFSKWAVFVNDDHTRSFVSMEVVAGGLAEITRQIHTVDEIYRLHNLPEFYKDPRPHISLAWALGDISDLLKRRVKEEHRYHTIECSSQKNALLLYTPAKKVSVISHLFQSLAMDRRLINVAKAGDIAGLYALLGDDQYILDKIDKVPFIDTPLHYAVLEGKTPFAMEVARLKPSFTRKHNKDGFSPMHLASKMGHVVIVKKLLAFDSDLCLVKGREWFTPLHCAAIEGKVEVINELLSLDACPKSIVEDLTVYEETALHLAAKNGQLEACRVLLEWLKQLSNQGVLEWKEDNIKTAMAAAGSHEVKELLVCEIKVNEVEINVINANHTLGVESNATNTSHVDQTEIPVGDSSHVNEEEIPLHQSEPVKRNLFRMVLYLLFLPFKLVGKLLKWMIACLLSLRGLLNNLLKPFDTFCKGNIRKNMEMRNALLVVGVLIATITFQAGLSPPGGVWQDNYAPEIQEIKNPFTNATVTTKVGKQHYAGKAVMGDRFDNFIIGNSIGFYASIILICIVTVGFPLQPLIIGTLWSMSSTYIEAISIISPRTITVGFFPQVFILLCVAYVLIPRLWGSKNDD